MRTKPALAAAISAPLLVVAALAAVAGAISMSPDTTASQCIPGAPGPAGDGRAVVARAGLDADQLNNARTIATVGVGMGVPPPGETIAIATAMQESRLRDLDHGDRDSLGLFQQRPSQGWGTPAQILDPVYASTQFYRHLLRVPGWRTMPTTDAAQAVQHSAYPDAYAQWQPLAQTLVAEITGTAVCVPGDGGDGPAGAQEAAADGYHYRIPAGTPAPIVAVIEFALAQLGKPYVYGATGPNAYDCSGLMQTAYARIGVRLPRTTFQQVDVGTPVYDLSQLQPGDLLFIPGSDGTPQAPGHVGMYLGDSLLIQAPHTGDRVKLTPLDQWTSSLAAVRRVL